MITVEFRLELNEFGDATWTAESVELPSLYATASTLVDCRHVAFEVLRAAGIQTARVAYALSE